MIDNSNVPQGTSRSLKKTARLDATPTASQRRAAAGLPPARRNWRRIPFRVIGQWMLAMAGKLLRAGCIVAIVFGVVAAIYLTDRRSPNLRTIGWLPRFLHSVILWTDYHGEVRNFPAYGLLALPFLVLARTPKGRAKAMLALAVFATVMEYTQLFIPTRVFDWVDIVDSWVGLAAAWFLMEPIHWAIHRLAGPKRSPRSYSESSAAGATPRSPRQPHPHAPLGTKR